MKLMKPLGVINEKFPLISIVIPTYNVEKHIEGCLQSLRNLDYPHYEVIVVDGLSLDRTVEIAKKYDTRILYEEKGTRSAACNVGIKHSNGEIIAFTDADCVVERDWLRKIVRYFTNPNVAVVGGRDLTYEKDPYMAKCIGLSEHHRPRPKKTAELIERIKGCNVAYRKNLLEETGGFNETLHYSEETELHYRIARQGKTLIFDPTITVWHRRRGTLSSYANLCYYASKERMKTSKLVSGMFKTKDFLLVLLSITGLVLAALSVLIEWTRIGAFSILLLSLLFYLRSYFRKTSEIKYILGYLLVFYTYCIAKTVGVIRGSLAKLERIPEFKVYVKPLRICYVAADVPVPYIFGGSTHVYEIAKNLSALGNEVHVVSLRISRSQLAYEKLDDFYIHRVFKGVLFPPYLTPYRKGPVLRTLSFIFHRLKFRFLWIVITALTTSNLVRKYKIDVIMERGSSFGIGAFVSILTRRPLVLEVIDPLRSELSLRTARKIIAYTYNLTPNRYRSKIEIVTAAANTYSFNPNTSGEDIRCKYGINNNPVVIYVGNFEEWQGIFDLITAATYVLKEEPTAKFLMVGDGAKLEASKSLASKLEIREAFIFTGGVNYEGIPKYLAAADVAVAPYNPMAFSLTKKYGFYYSPIKLFEYMAAGKPTVSTKVGSIPEILQDGNEGLLVDPGKPDMLGKAILAFLRDRDLARRMGENAREKVLKNFTWEKVTNRIYRICLEAQA